MVFSSITFVLFFLPVTLLIYLFAALVSPERWKYKVLNIVLLVSSMFFYAWGEPSYVILLLLSMILNYFFATAIEVNRGERNGTFWLFLSVAINICFLVYFKYMNLLLTTKFFGSIVNDLPEAIRPAPNFHIALPLGISFYTFQAISYLVDVYRGTAKVSSSLIDFGCYLTMFPQLVAGPIVRYESIAKELVKRTLSAENFAEGFRRFVFGLAKKMLLADYFGRIADAAFSVPNGEVSMPVAWAGMLFYTLQIYFDFSGYSDMAIGLGRMFGFTFPENFNYPYISKSIREFWRRWHMTLGGWFRDYLYIPLGGNRKGRVRTCLNLFIVFALCGFWHGADWMFLFWGFYYGVFLILERVSGNFPDRLPSWLAHVYTLAVVMIGWLIFRSDSIEQFTSFLKGLIWYGDHGFGYITPQTFKVFILFFTPGTYLTLAVGLLLTTPVYPWLRKKIGNTLRNHVTLRSSLAYTWTAVLLLVCYMPLYGATYNAFIYFRF